MSFSATASSLINIPVEFFSDKLIFPLFLTCVPLPLPYIPITFLTVPEISFLLVIDALSAAPIPVVFSPDRTILPVFSPVVPESVAYIPVEFSPTTLIPSSVETFFISDPDFPKIPIDSCPFTSIVLLFVTVAFSPKIPTDFSFEVTIVPLLSTVKFSFPFDEEFWAYIPTDSFIPTFIAEPAEFVIVSAFVAPDSNSP